MNCETCSIPSDVLFIFSFPSIPNLKKFLVKSIHTYLSLEQMMVFFSSDKSDKVFFSCDFIRLLTKEITSLGHNVAQ